MTTACIGVFYYIEINCIVTGEKNYEEIKSKKNELHCNKIFQETSCKQKERTLPKDMKNPNCHS